MCNYFFSDVLQRLCFNDFIYDLFQFDFHNKGGAVVIIDDGYYVKEANQQLGNTEFYTKLSNDTTELNRTNANASIKEIFMCLGCKSS